MWMLAADEVVTKATRDIQMAKSMFTIMWNPLRFHVIKKLSTGARMNSEYLTTNSSYDSKKK
jgi:hypothetical protein